MVMEKRNKAQRKRDARLPVARERASFDIFTTFPTAFYLHTPPSASG